MSQAFPPLGPEFEPFLYAVVCNEGNGTPLTIISAIARSGADPWTEAARIAKLPKAVALDVLARMIPDRSGVDSAAIVDRLFALLPSARESKKNVAVVGAKTDARLWRPFIPVVIALLIGWAIVSAFGRGPHSDAGQNEPPPPAPVADKAAP